MTSHDSALVLSLLSLSVLGCGGGHSSQPQPGSPVTPMASVAPAVALSPTRPILSEDLLEVTVFDAPDLSRSARVASDGQIALPLIGSVQAAGRTPTELATDIEARLKATYMVNPRVA